MLKTQEEIKTDYEVLIQDTQAKLKAIKIKIDRFSMVRVALLIVEIFAFISFVSSKTDMATLLSGISLLVPIGVFVVVVKKQNVLDRHQAYLKNLLWVYQNETNLLSGLANGYDDGTRFEDENHPYLSDLDIFGKSSLFALINRCSTVNGITQLATQFSHTTTKHEILARQVAVQEIGGHIHDTFRFRAILKGHDVTKIDQIKKKLQSQLATQLEFTKKSLLRTYVKILPYLTPALVIAAVLIGGKLWGVLALFALLNASITFFFTQKINLVYYGFSGGAALLNDYAAAIKWTEDKAWKSTYIQGFFDSEAQVSLQIKKLSKIIQAFDARLNILLGAVLNFFLMWDLRCCIKLDEWHGQSVVSVTNGLDRIGRFEELIAIATLGHNQPTWVFPEISDTFLLSTKHMGHPLIPAKNRVTNDFALLATPTVDIVTGSNMAGKSTFLRTLGINMVLAYAGAVVCASHLSVSIFKLLTYMRIKDSLNENTSTFKAELNRLKMILNHVVSDPNSFVLIDEMLRGTNSRDKYLGSKVFIEKLIRQGTPTLFATHDLQLSELKSQYKDEVRNYHFDIQLSDGEMNFDYQLKQGPCATFNAAILLKEIGLSLE